MDRPTIAHFALTFTFTFAHLFSNSPPSTCRFPCFCCPFRAISAKDTRKNTSPYTYGTASLCSRLDISYPQLNPLAHINAKSFASSPCFTSFALHFSSMRDPPPDRGFSTEPTWEEPRPPPIFSKHKHGMASRRGFTCITTGSTFCCLFFCLSLFLCILRILNFTYGHFTDEVEFRVGGRGVTSGYITNG